MAMRKLVTKTALTLAIALQASSAMASTNVAQGATVSISGSGFDTYSSEWGSGSFAPLPTVTDGIFKPEGTQWNIGSVFWSGGSPDNADYVQIALPGTATVSSFTVQADDNDTYLFQYLNGSSWDDAGTVPSVSSWGLVTRSINLSSPITTNEFRIYANGGDGFYAVSEFQAFGTLSAVPEPATWAMMLLGFGMVGFAMRKRNVRTTVGYA